MKRYQAKPFSQKRGNIDYAVWDWHASGYVIEQNGMVWVSDRKAVRIWAKYLNDNLPYNGKGRVIENIVNSLSI